MGAGRDLPRHHAATAARLLFRRIARRTDGLRRGKSQPKDRRSDRRILAGLSAGLARGEKTDRGRLPRLPKRLPRHGPVYVVAGRQRRRAGPGSGAAAQGRVHPDLRQDHRRMHRRLAPARRVENESDPAPRRGQDRRGAQNPP